MCGDTERDSRASSGRRLDVVLGHQHEAGGVAERDERVGAGEAAGRAGEPGLGEGGHDRLAGTAAAAGLVDHEDAPDGDGVAHDLVERQRRQPADVEDAAPDAVGGQPLGGSLSQEATVAPRDDEHIVAIANDRRRADRHVLVGP